MRNSHKNNWILIQIERISKKWMRNERFFYAFLARALECISRHGEKNSKYFRWNNGQNQFWRKTLLTKMSTKWNGHFCRNSQKQSVWFEAIFHRNFKLICGSTLYCLFGHFSVIRSILKRRVMSNFSLVHPAWIQSNTRASKLNTIINFHWN